MQAEVAEREAEVEALRQRGAAERADAESRRASAQDKVRAVRDKGDAHAIELRKEADANDAVEQEVRPRMHWQSFGPSWCTAPHTCGCGAARGDDKRRRGVPGAHRAQARAGGGVGGARRDDARQARQAGGVLPGHATRVTAVARGLWSRGRRSDVREFQILPGTLTWPPCSATIAAVNCRSGVCAPSRGLGEIARLAPPFFDVQRKVQPGPVVERAQLCGREREHARKGFAR